MLRSKPGTFCKYALFLPDFQVTEQMLSRPLTVAQQAELAHAQRFLPRMGARLTGAMQGLGTGAAGGGLAGAMLGVPAALSAGPMAIPAFAALGAGMGGTGGLLEGYSKGPAMARSSMLSGYDAANVAEREARRAAKQQALEAAAEARRARAQAQLMKAQALADSNERAARLMGMADDAIAGVKRYAPMALLGGLGAYGLSQLAGE